MSLLSIKLFGDFSVSDHRGNTLAVGNDRTRALIAWLSARLRETSGKLAERTRSRPRSIINLLDQIGEEGR